MHSVFKPSSRRLHTLTLAALVVAALTTHCAVATAHPTGPNVPYTMSVEDEWGNSLRTFHQGDKTYVLGGFGQRYNIRIQNQTGTRVEAVVSVDGRDVISGRIGDYVHERGYLIDAYDSVLIEGFRRNLDQVAAFRFTSPDDSYSSRMGTPQNVGVIGVAMFPERMRRIAPVYRNRPYRYEGDARRAAPRTSQGLGSAADKSSVDELLDSASTGGRGAEASAPAAAAPREENRLGTQYGEDRENHVQEVSFVRANATRPTQLITLRYDDEQGLLARGIQVYPPAPVVRNVEPEAFPYSRFAPPPP